MSESHATFSFAKEIASPSFVKATKRFRYVRDEAVGAPPL
jgi:hypothetical protein